MPPYYAIFADVYAIFHYYQIRFFFFLFATLIAYVTPMPLYRFSTIFRFSPMLIRPSYRTGE